MKKTLAFVLLLAAVAVVIPTPAHADVVISNTYTDGQANRFIRAMNRLNRQTCAYFGLAVGCTQNAVRREFCKRANLGDIATCDGATQWFIYADVASFHKRESLRLLTGYETEEVNEDREAAKAAWDAKTQAAKDALCPSFGLTAPCTPF